jgi:transposase
MYIRQTKTSTAKTGDAYYTYRLVKSNRVGDKVRQKTLLNLGKNFSLPKEKWGDLCIRIEQILSGQMSIVEPDEETEVLAQQYAAQMITQGPSFGSGKVERDYQEVDINSLQVIRPRSVGVEHVAQEALKELDIERILKSVGLSEKVLTIIEALIIARMAKPGSELATWRWLRSTSSAGELMAIDFEKVSLMALYRASDSLVKHREKIEDALFQQVSSLFSLTQTVTLYDLTNTFFEGKMLNNPRAKRARSKEKRNDCPLVTLGLVLDGSGFIRRSRMFKGSAAEPYTLQGMLEGLGAPADAFVVMDAGVATSDNISWLIKNGYRYIVVSRERKRLFDEDGQEIFTASGKSIRVHRVADERAAEVKLYCYSQDRKEKEAAMVKHFVDKFEHGLAKLKAGLTKPRAIKRRDKVLQKIGRLLEKSRGIGRHYKIELIPKDGEKVDDIVWEQKPIEGSMLTHPGVYCLRSNDLSLDEKTMWETYCMLTGLEAVFRSLKSELGLRPINHHKAGRADGHLFIAVLAYQAVHVIRSKLKQHNITSSWSTLRDIFSVQRRVTTTFRQRGRRTLNIRKATVAEPDLKKLYDLLGISATPGGINRYITDGVD